MLSKYTGPVCEFETAGPCGIVIFGASGDLTSRKLIPSLFELYVRRRIPDSFFIMGVARSPLTDETFREMVERAVDLGVKNIKPGQKQGFIKRCFYLSGQYDDDNTYGALKERIENLSDKYQTGNNIIFNIATP